MSKDGRGNYLTANEVLTRYPVLRDDFLFDEVMINKMASHRILWGIQDLGKRMWLIQETSVIYFIKYLKETQEHKFTDQK